MIMKGLLTIRLKERDKGSISLASRLTGIPSSKMLYPFIEEALRTNLGASLLYMIDRSAPFNRRHFERFMGALRYANGLSNERDEGSVPGNYADITPRVVIDYVLIMREKGLQQKLENAMEGVQISPDMDYIDLVFLSRICRDMGDRYIISGLPLDRLDAKGATRLFFSLMTESYYRNKARGTMKVLNARWYGNQELISKLVEDMASRYEQRYPARVVEAIEVNDAITMEAPRKTVKKKPIKASVKNAPASK